MKYFLLLVTLIFLTDFKATAQDEDYADYSYLWQEDSKKKKKKKKKKKGKEEAVVSSDTVSLPSDSLQVSADSLQQFATDTTKLPSADSLEQIPETIPVVQDTTEISEPEADLIEEEEIKPKEKKELNPVSPDFRAGMATGGGSAVNGGFTFTVIDDEYFVGLSLQPEIAIWKIGVGLNIPILYGLESNRIRTEMFKDGVGVARLITYIRYGTQKVDPVYVKVGQLSGTMIGFGGLVNNYTNSTSFEKRKIGLHYDVNYKGLVGLEGMYSDFNPSSSNLNVLRPYVRPLSFLSVPIVRTLELGTTFVSDKDQTKIPDSDTTSFSYNYTRNGINAFGLDAGINLLNVPFIQIDAFVNWSQLLLLRGGLEDSVGTFAPTETIIDGYKDGVGFSYGFNFRFNFIADVIMTDVRIERLNYTEHYVPQFFDTNYELNKDAKILSTVSAISQSGIYGSLTGHILQKARLGGSLLIPDDITDASPAVVQLNAEVERLADKVSFYASYFKGGLSDLGDAFKLDERSVAKVRFIYHMNRFLAAGVDYYWAFTPTGDGGYKATKYVSPYFGLSIAF